MGMNACAYMCTWMHAHSRVCMAACEFYACIQICMHANMHACVWEVRMHAFMRAWFSMHARTFGCMHACMHARLDACMNNYACMYARCMHATGKKLRLIRKCLYSWKDALKAWAPFGRAHAPFPLKMHKYFPHLSEDLLCAAGSGSFGWVQCVCVFIWLHAQSNA